MKKGLLEEICEDFEWILGNSSTAYQIIHKKLQRILRKIGQKLIIFVDGWNEVNLALARTIDQQSEKLAHYQIACVISMTSIAASRLLKDDAGNPSHIAQAAGITTSVVPLIEISPERQNESWSRVTIGKYSSGEKLEAYYKYSTTFGVTVPGLPNKNDGHRFVWHSDAHEFVEDPFLLRIGMEQFHEQVLPQFLDEPNLLQKSIELKAHRAVGLEKDCTLDLLTEIADEMFIQDVPVRRNAAMKRWGKPITDELPKGLFEAALLAKVRDKIGRPALDFYYSRERDFAVAYWARNWISKMNGTQEEIMYEISLTGQTSVGVEALRWFLKQPTHRKQLQRIAEFFSSYESSSIRRVILSSVCEIINWNAKDNQNWIQDIINKGTNDPDMLIRVETVKLIALFTEEQEDVASVINYNEEFISKLLEIEEEYPFDEGGVGFIVRDAFHHIHWDDGGSDSEHSQISGILENLLDHDSHFVRLATAKSLGDIAPDIFLSELSKRIVSSRGAIPQQMVDEYASGVKSAVSQYEERYYGSMCPGYLGTLKEDSEQLYEEYIKVRRICGPIITFYPTKEFSQRLTALLEDLKPDQIVLIAHQDSEAEDKEAVAQRNALRYQLPLPFNECDTNVGGN